MSINLYDQAVVDKIKHWVLDPNMTILSPDETLDFFQQSADQNNDEIKLPLISISRDRDIPIQITARQPLAVRGKTFNVKGDKADHLNAIPITLTYQLDIYTRYRFEGDEYLRNFVFNIINDPTLVIQIPYKKSNLLQKSFMELDPTISDNSDIPERLINTQFRRLTLKFNLKDAKLYSYTIKDIPKIQNTSIYIDGLSENYSNHSIDDSCEFDSDIN